MILRTCALLKHSKSVIECRFVSTTNWKLQDSSDGDREGKGSNASAKLNALLLSIIKEEKPLPSEGTEVQIPKPRLKQRLKKTDTVIAKKHNLGSKIVDAAKNVASEIEGDSKEVEAQLLHKLLYKDSPVKVEILKAASNNQSLTDLLAKMDVEKQERRPPTETVQSSNKYSRSSLVKKLSGRLSINEKPLPRKDRRVDLFGEKPLGLFDLKTSLNKGVTLKTWRACAERERKLSVTHPPTNYFEQMIDWTEKGIMWKFPIDNEQGLESEKEVSFASHVLLESHLENWCPTAGPIRHFMELVCVGLSRNHWLSADEKRQHILWYKEFFTEKKQLIKELGAGEIAEEESSQPHTSSS